MEDSTKGVPRASSKAEAGTAIPIIITGTNTGDERASFAPQDPQTNLDSSSKNYKRQREGAPQDQRGRAKDGPIITNLSSSSNTTRRLQHVS